MDVTHILYNPGPPRERNRVPASRCESPTQTPLRPAATRALRYAPRVTIRKLPSDFRVDERADGAWLRTLTPQAAPGHEHAIFRLVKQSLTTPEACAKLARALGVAPSRLEYAGLKDKHARTRQHVSISPAAATGSSQPTPASIARDIDDGSGDAWSATFIGFATSHVNASIIDANAFEIVVRDLSPREADAMIARARLLRYDTDDCGPSLLFTNYFGDQRFGSARHGAGFAARSLIDGDFEAALRLLIATPARKDSGSRRDTTRVLANLWGQWPEALATLTGGVERHAIQILASGGSFIEAFAALPHTTQSLCVEAYQSHLWNAAARNLTHHIATNEEIVADDDFGEMVFAPFHTITENLHAATMPMPARGVEPQPPWADAMHAALESEGLRMDQLTIPHVRRPAFRTADRPLFAAATQVRFGATQRDELASPRSPNRSKREVSFTLPRGSYATVLLRAMGQ